MKLFPNARRIITQPTVEPLSLQTVKDHLKVQHDLDDTLITIYMIAARQQAEKLTGKKFITQTWEFDFSRFPDLRESIDIPVTPAQTIESIIYTDTQGDQQTFGTLSGSPQTIAEYCLIRDTNNPRVALKLNQVWPIAAEIDNAVTLRVVAGLGDSGEDLPALWIAGMMLLAGHFYENRETVVVDDSRVQAIEIPMGIRDLLAVPKVG